MMTSIIKKFRSQKVHLKLSRWLFNDFFIRLALENYLLFAIASFLNVTQVIINLFNS